jgi:hypothetical protein
MTTEEKIDKLIETVARIDAKLDSLAEPVVGRLARNEADVAVLKDDVRAINKERWMLHGASVVLSYIASKIFPGGWHGAI